jgi:hypothetical protein
MKDGREAMSKFNQAGMMFRALFPALVCSALLAPTLAVSDTPKSQLPGGNWDSIKKLPDWSGMWTPGKAPDDAPASDKAGAMGMLFGFGIPFNEKYADYRDRRMSYVRGDHGMDKVPLSNSGLCIPSGEPLVMSEVSHEYFYSPGRVTMVLENGEVRDMWTDGRGHPSEDVSNPSFSGHSIAHWDKDTLVVDTVDILPDAEIYLGGHVTAQTHIVERFTRVGNKMRVRTVITDPVMFTKPWEFTRWFDREDREPVEYDRCTLEDRVKKGDGRLLGIDFNMNRDESGEINGAGEIK